MERETDVQRDTSAMMRETQHIVAQAQLFESRLRLARAQRQLERSGDSGVGESNWFAVGLLGLGACMGVVTGLSTHEGISTTLLTSVLGLLGGGTLTVGALRSDGNEVNVRQIGIGLFALGLGVILAILPSAWVREEGLPFVGHRKTLTLRSDQQGHELMYLQQQLDEAQEAQDFDAMSLACQSTLRPWSDTLERCSLARKEVGDTSGAQYLEKVAEAIRSWR